MAPPDAADLALVWRCGQLLHWLWPCVWLRLVAHTSAYSSAWDAEHQYHINSQQYWESMQHTSLYTPPPLLPSPLPQVPSQEDLAALRGGGRTYCARRWPPHCCSGRDDTCSVPILDTVCYCDAFCNRTVTDCCPDFWHYCMRVGMVPEVILHPLPLPELGDSLTPNTGAPNMMGPIKNNCHHKGWTAKPWEQMKVNCNNCTCVKVEYGNEFNWQCSQRICLIRSDLMEHVNGGDYGWLGTNYSTFWGMSLDDGVNMKLGTRRPIKTVKQMTSLRSHINDVIPSEFDSRVRWPGMVHPIMNQGNCGASWAFSTVSVMADRLTIHSKGQTTEMLSPQHLLSCNHDNMQRACDGGHLDRAWWFMRRVGVVSQACYPYLSGATSNAGQCQYPRYKMLSNRRVKCISSKYVATSAIYQSSPPYRVAPNEREIMKEIMDNGPVQATMEVKEDFFMYKGGVYRYSLPATYLPPNHRKTGFHSVKIIGWGTYYSTNHPPLKYWLCANSWGEKWGEDGYFKIVRGTNECMIESFVVSVLGRVNGLSVVRSYKGR